MNKQRHQQGNTLKTGLALLTLLALAACGSSNGVSGGGSGSSGRSSGGGSSSGASSSGSGSSGSSSGTTTGGGPAGLYLGILENPAAGSSDAMWGLIDAKNQGVVVDTTIQAVYRYNSLAVSGNKFSGGFVSFTPSSSGGTTLGGGSVRSSFAAGDSLTGYLAFSDATLPAFSFSNSYQAALYAIPASFATIAGSYTFGSNNGNTLTVASDGSFTLAYTGCTAKGSFSIPDPAHNAYELSGTQTCSSTTLNITGLASYTPPGTVTNAQLTFEYDDGKTIAVEAAATK